jgi:uncharacterized membrane protein YccF (DUF307 family)
MGWFMDQINRFICYTNREPILKIRRIIWMVTAGWWLALLYLISAVGFCMTLVFIPLGIKAFSFALFAFDPVTKEAFKEGQLDGSFKNPVNGVWYYYRIAANIVWLVLVGWALAMGHLMAAIVSALTIIGLGTAYTNIRLMLFAIWPFGQSIREQYLPTTLEEYKRHEDTIQEMARRSDIQKGRPQYGADV